MATESLYKSMPTLLVPGETHSELKKVTTEVGGFPFRSGHIPAFCAVAIKEDDTLVNRYHHPLLYRVTDDHGRSFEIKFGETDTIFWQDEYGNLFSVLTSKGNDLTNPDALRDTAAPSDIRFSGLQDIDAMFRILNTSRNFRAHQIDTEAIVRFIEPEQLPFGGQLVSGADFKTKLRDKIWEQNLDIPPEQMDANFRRLGRIDSPHLSKALHETTFFITIRGMQAAERFSDLAKAETVEEFKLMVRKAFRFINKEEERKAKKDKEYEPRFLDISSEDDIYYYISEYLPKRAGKNYGRMHKLKTVHIYSHAGNVSTIGGIHDLDSVKGELTGCGDESITEEEIKHDLRYLLEGNEENRQTKRILAVLQQKGFIKDDLDLYQKFVGNFNLSYIYERGWEEDVAAYIEDINILFNDFTSSADRVFLNHYLELLAEQAGIAYQHPANIIELIGEYISLNPIYFQRVVDAGEAFGVIDPEETNEVIVGLLKDFPQRELARFLLESYERGVDRYFEDNPELLERFGDTNTTYLVKLLIINRTFHDQSGAYLTATMFNELEKLMFNELEKFQLMRKIKQFGWEENILEHIEYISTAFGKFTETDDQEVLDYYLGILSDQLGWRYQVQNTPDELMDTFFKDGRARLIHLLDVHYTNGLMNQRPLNLEYNELVKFLFLNDFNAFLVHRLRDECIQLFASNSLTLRDKLGEGDQTTINTIINMMVNSNLFRIRQSDQMNLIDFYGRRFIDEYKQKADINIYRSPQIDEFIKGIDREVSSVGSILVFGKRVTLIGGLSLEEYFRLLSETHPELNLTVVTSDSDFDIPISRYTVRYLISDGAIFDGWSLRAHLSEEASYLAFIARDEKTGEPVYKLQTPKRAREIRKVFNRIDPKNISLTCSQWH